MNFHGKLFRKFIIFNYQISAEIRRPENAKTSQLIAQCMSPEIAHLRQDAREIFLRDDEQTLIFPLAVVATRNCFEEKNSFIIFLELMPNRNYLFYI